MRLMAKGLLALMLVGLAAGPALALPVGAVVHTPTLTASTSAHFPTRAVSLLASLAGVVFGITIRKDAGSIANKFATRAAAAQGDYKDGVAAAGPKWEAATAAAESSYEGGVQQAISRKAFAAGVSGKGGKFQANAVNLGSQRYGPGVTNAKDAYARGIAPVLQTLSSLQLPARGFRGSPQNQQRSNAVATALAAMRTGK
jgi:hypothetical protein